MQPAESTLGLARYRHRRGPSPEAGARVPDAEAGARSPSRQGAEKAVLLGCGGPAKLQAHFFMGIQFLIGCAGIPITATPAQAWRKYRASYVRYRT